MDVPEENQDDWVAECSDDENYKLTPTDIIELYQRIGRGENLELEWKCPGRRSPTPERNEENVAIKEEVNGESITEHRVVVAEFDFDELAISDAASAITPRRSSVGSVKTPRSNQKRVAQLDKIMNDMRRHRKMDEESRKTPGVSAKGGEGNNSPRPVNSRKASPKAT